MSDRYEGHKFTAKYRPRYVLTSPPPTGREKITGFIYGMVISFVGWGLFWMLVNEATK